MQGVGFRMTTQDVAHHIDSLTGFVRNAADGTVQGEVQGAQPVVEKFLRALEASPAGRVERVERETMAEVEQESGFVVR